MVTISAGAAAAGACSDDAAGPSNAGTGGEGGEPEAAGGMAGKPSSAGSSQLGGAGGESGAEAGAAGMPQLPTAGEQCTQCGATECSDELESCTANPECAPWLACLTRCEDAACIDACDSQYEDVARVYYPIYACLCDSCEAQCAATSACDKQCVDDNGLPPTSVVPATLAETGLFDGGEGGAGGAGGAPPVGAGAALELAPYVRSFEPKYPLWADGAVKDRYVYIPRCSTIDTTDMDHWRFPVGTRLWKHFIVGDNAAVQRVETRLMHRHGPGEADWLFAAYQWDATAPDDPSAALSVPAGVVNANGTTHDIPGLGQCTNCHDKQSEKVLGFGAFQLSHAGAGHTIELISNLGWLTTPAPEGFEPPGTAVQKAALGYLHGNCGGCHNSNGQLPAADPMLLKLLVAQTDYAETDTVTTSVGISTISGNVALNGKPRIDPMVPGNSTILLRMQNRDLYPMPPIASKAPDSNGGVADVTAWINSIPLPQ